MSTLLGGPLDGLEGPKGRPSYVWCTSVGGKLRAFITKGAGRHLYYEVAGRYEYAGHRFEQCPACDGWIARGAQCVCGGA